MKATECGEIMQTDGHYAVQGHLRSPLAPIESLYIIIKLLKLHWVFFKVHVNFYC